MKTLSKFLEGKKTYIGALVAVVGMTGLAAYITPGETEALTNHLLEAIGIVLVVAGRYAAK